MILVVNILYLLSLDNFPSGTCSRLYKKNDQGSDFYHVKFEFS